jgi:hypothetical protein
MEDLLTVFARGESSQNLAPPSADADDVELVLGGALSARGPVDAAADGEQTKSDANKKEKEVDEQKHVLSHNGFRLLMTYEVAVFLLILFELFEIPFRFAFIPVSTYPLGFLIWAALVDFMFIFDVAFRFFLPFLNSRAQYVTGPREKVQSRYLRTWFVPDAISAIPWDFFLLCVTQASPGISMYWLPYARITRFLRLFQIFRRLTEWEIVVNWSFDPVVLRATAIVIASFLWLSLNACLFWMVAALEGRSWSWIFLQDPNNLAAQNPFVQYLGSLYWAIVTFSTCGFGDLSATTLATRIYVTFYCIISIGILAYATGNVVSWLQSASAAKTVVADKLESVKNYSEYRGFGPDLSRRLLAFHRFKGLNDVFPHNDAVAIGKLPPALRAKLGAHFRSTVLKHWGLPQICDDYFVAAILMRMKRERRYPGDYVAMQGSRAKKFYLLTSGQAEVSVNGMVVFDMAVYGGSEPAALFGESVLFGEDCIRQATFRAIDFCDLLYLKQRDIKALMELFPQYKFRLNAYGAHLKATYAEQNAALLKDIRGGGKHERVELEKIANRLFARDILNDPYALAKVMALESGVPAAFEEGDLVFSATDCIDWLVNSYNLKRPDAEYVGKRLLRLKLIAAQEPGRDFADVNNLFFRFSRSALGLAEVPIDACFALDVTGATPTPELSRLVHESPDFVVVQEMRSRPELTIPDRGSSAVELPLGGDADGSSEDEEAGLFRRGTVMPSRKQGPSARKR